MSRWLAPAHLILTIVIVVWNVLLAGRIAQLRQASRLFATLTGFAGLMIIPALIVSVATTTVITGRSISAIDWIWPAIVVILAIQAIYAVAKRLVNPLWGYPIAIFNTLLALAVISRFLAAQGHEMIAPFRLLAAAEINALVLATTDAAILSPFFLHVPFIAPAFPALHRWTAGFRAAMAAIALLWFGLIVAELPRADVALASYESHADDRLRERPDGFSVGIKILPDVANPPSPASIRSDVALAEWLGARTINVVFVPGASILAVDSVARVVDGIGRDSLLVIATIGYSGKLLPELGRSALNVAERVATIRRVLSRLRPEVILPAQDPYGMGARILGELPVETWKDYYVRTAAVVREVRPRTRIGFSAAAFHASDSALYAWAAAPGSPVDWVGFSFAPSRLGARTLDANFRAADRWMLAVPPRKPHWVWSAGGYPLAHGESSQERAIWASLTWATSHAAIRGVVVTEAGDYGQSMGLGAPDGRFRRAAYSVKRAIKGLRESAGQPTVVPAPPVR